MATSRFGGVPELPPTVPWPTWDASQHLQADLAEQEKLAERVGGTGALAAVLPKMIARARARLESPRRPLDFLGQLNLADATFAGSTLPAAGLLSFFYARETMRWGFDPNDRGSAQVVYTPAEAFDSLRALAPPAATGVATSQCKLTFRSGVSLPQRLQNDVKAAGVTREVYDPLRSAILGESTGPLHQVLGHSTNIQGDMRLECQLASNGINCGTPSGYRDPRRKALEAGAADWTLLAQFDTDEPGPNWIWGDCGRIYFWIRRPDLARADFSQVWCVLQCS
jgi:uncharacterized protein YwqG